LGNDRHATAEARSSEVEEVGDHASGTSRAADDGHCGPLLFCIERLPVRELLRPDENRGQRSTQVVTENGDQPFARFHQVARVGEVDF